MNALKIAVVGLILIAAEAVYFELPAKAAPPIDNRPFCMTEADYRQVMTPAG
jgi:hypothetical protein